MKSADLKESREIYIPSATEPVYFFCIYAARGKTLLEYETSNYLRVGVST